MDKCVVKNQACEKALKIKSRGYNCAQSVLGALAEYIGLKEDHALRLMTAFGGGMKHEQLCGALIGAGAALSWKFSTTDSDKKTNDKVAEMTLALVNSFKEENNTSICKELLESDFSEFKWDVQIEGVVEDTNKQCDDPYGLRAPICGKVITDAVIIALDICKTDQ